MTLEFSRIKVRSGVFCLTSLFALGVSCIGQAETFEEALISAYNTHPQLMAERARLREICLLYTSPSPRDRTRSRMPSSA